MRQKENEKKLLQLADKFEEKGDTLFSIYSCNKVKCGVILDGNPSVIAAGVYNILKNGLSDKADEFDITIFNAFLSGFKALLSECGIESLALADALNEIFNEIGDNTEDFNPSDENCRACESFECCLKKMVGDLGYDIKKREN